MSNRNQLVPRLGGALLACGLLLSLLPDSAAAKDSSDKPPVEERAHSPTSSQDAIPAERGLRAMPMTAPVENSLDCEVAQTPAVKSKVLSDMESLENWKPFPAAFTPD
jgi:hypothetical protein